MGNNLLMGTDYELKNRFLHIDYVHIEEKQSDILINPKCQNDTLKCTLEQITILKLIEENPTITQIEISDKIGKSVRTIKREMDVLKKKEYIRRVNGKRNGKWELLIKLS